MKKTLLLLSLLGLFTFQGFSQLLSDEKMTFYGLDFSKARMIGDGFSNPQDVRDRFFNNWNAFFKSDDKDYDVGAAFKKDVTLDYTDVERNNKAVNVSTLVTNNDYSITAADAEKVVKGYTAKGAGLGCAFVVESFDKSKVAATIYVVFFDIATKRIVLTKKEEGKPGGFGLKNYWGNSVRDILHECKKDFPKWLKGK